MNSPAPTVNTGQAVATNFDVKEKKFTGNQKGIPIAGNYAYPNGSTGSAIGEYINIPQSGEYVVTVQNGQLSFVAVPTEGLQLFNNSLGWTQTESCDE
jgi:hypothetical protein